MSTLTAAQWYDANADLLASRYETVRADELHRWLNEFLSADSGAQALDVGAGSGRDAAWLAYKGYEVIAVEPSAKLRAAA
jgi:protein-L-isoaspartate O-methyltransferase